MTKPKTQSRTWEKKIATALSIAGRISDVLDADEQMEPEVLELIAEAMADAFEFTDEERDEFVLAALINHGGRAGDDDDEEEED